MSHELFISDKFWPLNACQNLQLTAIGAEASNTNAGRSAALTSPRVRSRQLHRVAGDRMIVIVATLSAGEACCDVIAGGETDDAKETSDREEILQC